MVILSLRRGIPRRTIARFLRNDARTISDDGRNYSIYGCERLMEGFYRRVRKSDDERLVNTLHAVLHAPPSAYEINRTTWIMADLRRVLAEKGQPACAPVIRKIIRDAGYSLRKAREVLTSNDPDYQEKLEKIRSILSALGPDERFFSRRPWGRALDARAHRGADHRRARPVGPGRVQSGGVSELAPLRNPVSINGLCRPAISNRRIG
jgi:hypothetical protein